MKTTTAVLVIILCWNVAAQETSTLTALAPVPAAPCQDFVPILLPQCPFRQTNSIRLSAFIEGNFLERHQVQWGRANFGLTETNLSIEINLPAMYAPYSAVFGGPIRAGCDGVAFDLSVPDCTPLTATNAPPSAVGLEELPRCRATVAVCIPSSIIADLLAGQYSLGLFSTNYPPAGALLGGTILPVDADRDGVPDYIDACPNTPQRAVVNTNGCSIEQLCPCEGPWRNHGEYVNCMNNVTASFLQAGLITAAQKRTLLIQAAQSNCGKR